MPATNKSQAERRPRRGRKVTPPSTRAARLQSSHAREDRIDPFVLARAFVDQDERDHAEQLTLRHWRGEWYRYRDGRYVKVDEATVRRELTGFVKCYYDDNNITDDWGIVLAVTKQRIMNVLNALAPMVGVADDIEHPVWLGEGGPFDFLALRNGLLDVSGLAEGSLAMRANSPLWFSTVVLPYDYVEDAVCPQWFRFLDEVMEGDGERIALLQEWAGYLLTSDTSQHKFLVAEGEGANGKSVLLDVLTAMLGQENVSQVPLEMFGQRFQLTPTIDKLANICAEVGEINAVAEGTLKQFTAGDRMYFDRKGIPGVMRYPTARLILATNNRPRFRDRSMGIWRRILLVPFRYTVPPERQDKHLTRKLKGELPGIFLWALAGLKRLRTNGHFTVPQTCAEVLEEYRLESNPARVFITEHLKVADGEWLPCASLYDNYVEWSKGNGFEALNSKQFGAELRKVFPAVQRKRKTVHRERGWCYVGVAYGPTGPNDLTPDE
jgi:putative DNA primase/helicase